MCHRPVLLNEVVELLQPADKRVIVDCTLGLGGHAAALLQASCKDAQLVGMDADEGNVICAKKNLASFGGRVRFFHANFSHIQEVFAEVGLAGADAILADLGFCSNQMDDSARGLSFTNDGPLDMRLNRDSPRTAADLVNQMDEKELADLIYQFGEERLSRRIARAIVAARKTARIERTAELAEIITRAMPRRPGRRHDIHPATRTFQALRIAVNDELTSLDTLLGCLGDILMPGGRAAIISFHSLEDRRVKHAFADFAGTGQAKIITKKPVVPAREEIFSNPRSRSAKLRVIEKI